MSEELAVVTVPVADVVEVIGDYQSAGAAIAAGGHRRAELARTDRHGTGSTRGWLAAPAPCR